MRAIDPFREDHGNRGPAETIVLQSIRPDSVVASHRYTEAERWARHLPCCFRPKRLNRQVTGPDDGRSDHGHTLFRASGPWLARTLTVPRIAFRPFGSAHEADSELSTASSFISHASRPENRLIA
jgi:hypothetical protein